MSAGGVDNGEASADPPPAQTEFDDQITDRPASQPVQTMPIPRNWVVGLGIVGVLLLPGVLPVGLILLAASVVYLLWSRGRIHPATEQRKAAKMGQATASLQDAARLGMDGATVVAYRNLWATAKREYKREAQAKVDEALASIGLNARSLDESLKSPQIGVVPSLRAHDQVEVFRDWIIYGQESGNVDATTRGYVHVEGSVQVTTAMVQKGKKLQQQITHHDMRKAELHLVSSKWSMAVPIHPDKANEARRVVEQLAAHVESLKPQGVTARDIKAMVDTVLNNTGQPPAEKLQQLSNLRYERLLSDEEFEQAKSRILGIR